MLERGYTQLYTGNGKGKTTAAIGLAFRASGSGLKTIMIQFMKGQHYGELDSAVGFTSLIIGNTGVTDSAHWTILILMNIIRAQGKG